MIIREYYTTRKDGINLFRTYSDNKVMIRKVGTDEIYDEAIDVETAPYVYEETDQPIVEVENLLKVKKIKNILYNPLTK